MADPHARPAKTSRLPDEHIPTANLKSMGVVYSLALVVVLLLNAGGYVFLQRLDANKFRVITQEKWALLDRLASERGAAEQAGGVSLILGDSSANQGLDPAVLGDAFGERWVNLGTMANLMMLDGTWMLRQYIETNGPPSRVILMHTQDGYDRDTHAGAFAQVPLPFRYWKHVSPRPPLGPVKVVELAAARYVPLYSSNASLKMGLMYPWKVRAMQPVLTADGFMAITEPSPVALEADTAEQREALREWFESDPRPSVMRGFNRAAIGEVMAMASEHGFPVYFVHGPVAETLTSAPGYDERVAATASLMRELQAEHTGFRVLFEEPVVFPQADMADSTEHLLAGAAARFTSMVAERIRLLEGPAAASAEGEAGEVLLSDDPSGDSLP
ncbi:MAG: hypothetical protein AAF797_06660 [Planctomycetota bacterium]